MAKFKNKKTGTILEESLIYYINKLRENPDYMELKEDNKNPNKEERKPESETKE